VRNECFRRPERRLAARGRPLPVSQSSTVQVVGVDVFQASPAIRTAEAITTGAPAAVGAAAFPRKEVIQPQLPLRLPCYDFTPITDATFGRCLPKGLAHGLRVFPAFVV
jgi:hypothetical protein